MAEPSPPTVAAVERARRLGKLSAAVALVFVVLNALVGGSPVTRAGFVAFLLVAAGALAWAAVNEKRARAAAQKGTGRLGA